ncbi:MAG TPA: c-type cytochrome [Candidatus Eisenbacteria bacterium]|nr:c-type cytochrome [Candidatus Eisenbacteria bacterium]
MARRSIVLAVVVLLPSIGLPGASPGQIPDTFKNLNVLPKDTPKAELVSVMRGFSSALGVRCNHCHVGENAATLEGFDFASDDKEPKRIARVMMSMVQEINQEEIPKAGIKDPASVRCVTCHRGVTKPRTVDEVLRATVEKDGVPAAQKRYRELREQYHGSGSYDFRPGPVNMVAEWLAFEKKDYDGAIALLGLNVEFHPTAGSTHNLLGRIHEAKGDPAAAIASWKKALELDPKDNRSRQLLEKAEGKK